MWGLLAKQVLKAGVKKVAKDKLFNRKKKRPKKRASGKEVADGIMNKGEEGKKGGALAVRPTTGLVHTKSDFDPVSTCFCYDPDYNLVQFVEGKQVTKK